MSTTAWCGAYHPLLLELLRRRADSEGADRQIALDAHTRATRHHLAAGDAAMAVRHAELSGDAELLCSVLVELGPELIAAGESAALAQALRRLPREIRASHVPLLGVEALLLRELGDVSGALRVCTSRQ